MANTVTCWLRGGWDLSFLDPDSVRYEERSMNDRGERTNCTVWSNNSGQCRKQNSLALIVRRRRIHSYCEIAPLPFNSTQLPLTLENTDSQSEDNSIDDRALHEYVNSPTKTNRSTPPPPPLYQNLAAGCLPEPPPPLVPPRDPVSPSGAGRCSSRACPSIQLSPAAEKTKSSRTPPPPPTPSESPSSSVADGRLLRPATAALCRISASPAADSSSAFSYRDVEDNDIPRPELRHWRATQCFSTWDEDLLTRTFRRLSACSFYLGRLSFDDAKRLLHCCPVGTFLLRDSSDERFPFSLSVQTLRGTTSIRIIYDSPGLFRLDSEPEQVHLLPTFDCVLKLIKFYVDQSAANSGGALNNFVLLQMNGQRDMSVILRRPYERRPPSLSHLCRKRINASLGNNNVNRLQLIPSLKAFLIDYPYDI